MDQLRQLSECEGKQRFQSRDDALRVARRIRRSKRGYDIYRCRYCRSWHVGTKRVPAVAAKTQRAKIRLVWVDA